MAAALGSVRSDLVERASAYLMQGRRVALVGVAGVGKTTVFGQVRQNLLDHGMVMLDCSPGENDSALPFVALTDLLSQVPAPYFDGLAPRQHRALDVVLSKQQPDGAELDGLAARVGALNLLRAFTSVHRVALSLDDVQWIDKASAEVLAFVLKRLPTLAVLAVERVAEERAVRRGGFLPDDTIELDVGPLPEDMVMDLVMRHGGGLVSRSVAAQICDAAAGNPLFALEITSALFRRGLRPMAGEPLPVPAKLEVLMRQRLGALTESARDTLRVASAAARPTLTLLNRVGCATAVQDLSDASKERVAYLRTDGSVEFGHPLMRTAVYAEASFADRTDVHARLATAVTDPIESARHLALARPVEDAEVAASLSAAAEMACRRGALSVACELAELAEQRTPSHEAGARADRRIIQARYAERAGRFADARRHAQTVLAAADVPSAVHAKAWLIVLETLGNSIGHADAEIEASLAATAAHPHAHNWVLMHAAWHHILNGRPQRGLDMAQLAARNLGETADTDGEIRALEAIFTAQRRLGMAVDKTLQRCAELAQASPHLSAGTSSVIFLHARSLYADDRLVEALAEFQRAASMTEQAALLSHHVIPLHWVRKTQQRLGQCEAALATADRILQVSYEVQYLALNDCANAQLMGGDPQEAIRLAAMALAEAQREGDRLNLATLAHTLGLSYLLSSQPAAAVPVLVQAHEAVQAKGTIYDGPAIEITTDLAEALVRIGEINAAKAIFTVPSTCTQLSRSSTAAVLRTEAALRLAEGDAVDAAHLLRKSISIFAEVGMPLEQARCLVNAAEVERRCRRRAAATGLLKQARELCVRAAAKPWIAYIDTELARLEPGSRDSAADKPLTPTQLRVTQMIIDGASNRDIANALNIAITTVESAISTIYRKHGVRSRVELVRQQTDQKSNP